MKEVTLWQGDNGVVYDKKEFPGGIVEFIPIGHRVGKIPPPKSSRVEPVVHVGEEPLGGENQRSMEMLRGGGAGIHRVVGPGKRRGSRSWTRTECQELVAMHNAGVDGDKMARRFGRSVAAIYSRLMTLRRAGWNVNVRWKREREWTEQEEQQVMALWNDGHVYRSIATMLDRSHNCVYVKLQQLREQGHALRTRRSMDLTPPDAAEVTKGEPQAGSVVE